MAKYTAKHQLKQWNHPLQNFVITLYSLRRSQATFRCTVQHWFLRLAGQYPGTSCDELESHSESLRVSTNTLNHCTGKSQSCENWRSAWLHANMFKVLLLILWSKLFMGHDCAIQSLMKDGRGEFPPYNFSLGIGGGHGYIWARSKGTVLSFIPSTPIFS